VAEAVTEVVLVAGVEIEVDAAVVEVAVVDLAVVEVEIEADAGVVEVVEVDVGVEEVDLEEENLQSIRSSLIVMLVFLLLEGEVVMLKNCWLL
jgi:hypothetical protein